MSLAPTPSSPIRAPASPTRSELGAEFWDPPCRVCKVVDDEPNVLCELCNSAYHLACIENIKPPLPRTPDDDEWFCRACIKRGVPECILDRTGRDSSAYFLIKWLGREAWDVSWEDAKTLDTPWCRRLVRAFVASEPLRRATAPLLPPSHPLVDRLRTRIEIKGARGLGGRTTPVCVREKPTVKEQERALELFEQLETVCKRLPCKGHLLQKLSEEAMRLLPLLRHPQCEVLAPWGDGPEALREATATQLERAACALTAARKRIVSSLGPSAAAAIAVATTTEATGCAVAEADGYRLQLANNLTGYRGVTSNGSKFAASVRHEGKQQHLGSFATAVEAAIAIAKFGGERTHTSPSATSGAAADGRTTPEAKAAVSPAVPKELTRALACLAELCAQPQPGHLLAPAVREIGSLLLLLQRHPECDSVGGASLELETARDAARGAVRSLLDLREALDAAFGPPPLLQVALRPNAYHGFLLHLRERRAAVRAAQPAASAREVERLVAAEWGAMDAAARAPVMERALAVRQAAVREGEKYARRREGGGREEGGGRRRRRVLPCVVCLEPDERDAVVCVRCKQSTHLMCMFPPLEAAPEEYTCIGCRCSPPPPPGKPEKGDVIEVEVKEHADLALHVGKVHGQPGQVLWKSAVCREAANEYEVSRLEKTKRFLCCVNEEEDFIEEFGMEDEGTEWRWPSAVHTKHAEEVAAALAGAAEVAREKEAIAELIRIDTEAPETPWLGHVEQLYREGLCVVEQSISNEQVQACVNVVDEGYRRYMHSIKTLDLQEKLQDVGFMEIKMRSAGRYDLQLPELANEEFSFLRDNAPWMPLVKAALGGDAQLVHFGCMLSFPGSVTQPWHSDGPHIRSGGSPSFVAPPHALNVFVPLVDLSTANGATEYVPGSQFDFDVKNAPCTPTPKAGAALLFDYRLKHRGHGNSTNLERPLIYMTYARPFFFDVYNFDRKRYAHLTMVEDHGSREERMRSREDRQQKRQRPS
ncbi:hypothetical protein AB1Y20_011087 [Prymnesium parvum]|uniref:Uncharacterized protein n=1 Tax=Prymnesium parvum TaxID=97485 RepID=A0AB34IPG8_PRYPA